MKTVTKTLRMEPALAKDLDLLARADRRSFNGYVVATLAAHVAALKAAGQFPKANAK